MPWIILLVSAVFEAVWATALGHSDGFTRPVPTAVFVAAMVVSMVGLGVSLKSIPVSTAYAVWVGVGAALTVTVAMIDGTESVSPLKLAFLACIVGAVAGLKLLPATAQKSTEKRLDGPVPIKD